MDKRTTKSKSAIAEAIMLTYPDVFRPFILYTDASNYAIGVLLTQENKTIFCFSKKLIPTQQNNTITDKKLLAVMQNQNIIFCCEGTVWTAIKICHDDIKHINQKVLGQRVTINQEYGAKES